MVNVFGTSYADRLFGGSYNSEDYISAGAGDDYINAYGGNDVIYAGSGNDTIRGGQGMDIMYGGSGYDTFRFSLGDSGPGYYQADMIMDFNRNYDWISFDTIYGTANNYVEYSFHSDGTYSGAYNQALAYAHEDIGGGTWFAFYTDGHDGYLFADLDLNGTVDTGIELRGLTSTTQFSYLDII